jgi:hypothetical protein
MAHTYTYDALYRLVSATGTYTGADNKTLYAVILKRGGNLAVRTALLDCLQGLATAVGMCCLHIMKCISHGSGADSAKGNKSKIQRENPLIVPADF